jgi:hypothetical protein
VVLPDAATRLMTALTGFIGRPTFCVFIKPSELPPPSWNTDAPHSFEQDTLSRMEADQCLFWLGSLWALYLVF